MRDLAAEIQAYLETHRPSTATEIAAGIRARYFDVYNALLSFDFQEAPTPPGEQPRAVHWTVAAKSSQPIPSRQGRTHKERVLDLLSDGEPHSHMEGYRLGVMLHSRVADLRSDGHVIECWRDGDNYLYRLVSSLEQPPPNPQKGGFPSLASHDHADAPSMRDDGGCSSEAVPLAAATSDRTLAEAPASLTLFDGLDAA